MAGTRSHSSGLFSGLVLISVGILLLLHNYQGLMLGAFLRQWWPLLIIFWGVIKLYERTVGRRFGSEGGITAGEILLVLVMVALLVIVATKDYVNSKVGDIWSPGNDYSYDLDISPKTIPANAPVVVRTVRGDITVRASDTSEIQISAKKNVKSWSDNEAARMAKPVNVEISQNGDTYEVHPTGYDTSDARISVDLDITVPQKSALTVRTEKGDVQVSDFQADVSVTDQNGDVEVRGTNGGVLIDTRKGDVKVSDTKGDIKISGKGGEIETTDISGSLTVQGDFYGPVRAERVSKGVRLLSPKTDLTVSAVAGHLEVGSGNLDLVDAPGNVTLRTHDTEVTVENAGGKLDIDNRNAQTSVRFLTTPKDDVSITNSSAGISLTLPGSSSFEIQADCRNCDIESEFAGLDVTKSESGDAHLAGKYGSGKGPKITLRTSYGNIEMQRTSISPKPAPAPSPMTVPSPPHVPNPPSPEVPPATEQ